MNKNPITMFLGAGLLVAVLLWQPLLATAPTPDVRAGTDLQAGSAIGPAQAPTIVGSWLADIDIPVGPPEFDAQALLTFNLGGALSIVDTTDMGGHPISGGLDSVGYGAWEVDGDTIELRYVVFNYELLEQLNDDTGEVNTVGSLRGYTRITDTVELVPPDFDFGIGTYSIETFDLGEDPLGPPREPDIGGMFTMRRITVD